ncbi:50S ribosomal protein L18 [Ectothiorhodospiraceae bacterium BW-2]|nr:50S ribosomal protein L18 [Ectothiorhodospiraceae bacterium BW-2]
MNDKKQARVRRATKGRAKIRKQGIHRLSVNRTPRHIYAQVTSANGDQVMAAASTVMGEVKSSCDKTGNIEAAKLVGKAIAERARAAGISRVAFDRSGFQYHGRVKALADAAREHGLEF